MKREFFTHKECESYPCHDVDGEGGFNCLFCFCPLYTVSGECGGDYTLTVDGIKDCSGCSLPHDKNSYAIIMQQLKELYEA